MFNIRRHAVCDSRHDHQTAYCFALNPAGVKGSLHLRRWQRGGRILGPGLGRRRARLIEPRASFLVGRLRRDVLAGGLGWNLNLSRNRWNLNGQIATARPPR